MYTELNEKLKSAQYGILRKTKLESTIKRLRWEREQLKKREKILFEELQNENLDVEKLKNMSFKKVVYTIFNVLVERTEKEKKEALEAKMKYDLVKNNVRDIDQKLSMYKDKLSVYIDSEQQYEDLYNKKKELLMQDSPEAAYMIMETVKEINKLSHTVKETKEALDAGKQALLSIDQCEVHLQKARNWAWWEPRRSLVISAVKEIYLEKTQNAIWDTSSLIRSFNEELTDIGVESDTQIEDVFFEPETLYEEFFWRRVEREKMGTAQRSLNAVRSSIERIMSRLQALKTQSDKQAKNRKDQLNRLVLQA